MAYFQNQILIEQPPEAVFRFVADLENLSQWDPTITKVNNLTEGLDGIGAMYQQESKAEVEQLRVVEFKPNERRIIFEMLPPARALSVMITVQAEGSSTRLTEGRELFTGGGWIVDRWISWRLRRQAARNLIRLKQVLEG